MAKASDIIKQAQKWIGKKEADGSFKEIINVYNGHNPLARGYAVKYTDEWCATFVSAVSIMCNATKIMPTECSCQKMIDLYKALGVWVENENRTPNVGDIIFYDWQDNGKGDNQAWSDHVGIVEKVEGGKITVIEGNYNSAVARRVIEVNGRYIRGYATPKYEKEATVAAKPTTTTSTTTVSPYYPKYTGTSTSLDTMLKAIGVPSKYYGSWNKRKPIAKANGISMYFGFEIQNIKLKRLAREGKLKRV